MASRKDVKQFARRLTTQGVEARATSGGHVQYLYQGQVIATGSQTPSDYRSLKNTEAAIMRAIRAQQEGVVDIVSPAPQAAALTGPQKLIEQKKAEKQANLERIRKVLVSAKEPLTVDEIATRTGLASVTVTKAAAELGLQRRKAQHSERGATLMGANPFLYYLGDGEMPSRRSPVEGSGRAAAKVAPIKAAPTKPVEEPKPVEEFVEYPGPEGIEPEAEPEGGKVIDLTERPTAIAPSDHGLKGCLMEIVHTIDGSGRVLATCDQGHLYVMDVRRLDV